MVGAVKCLNHRQPPPPKKKKSLKKETKEGKKVNK